MSPAGGARHYGRGTVAVGAVLLTLTGLYAVQVASVVRHTRDLLANPLPAQGPDGGMQFDLRTVAIYDFLFTSQAWGLAHLWLFWVVVIHFARDPDLRVRLVRSLAAALLALVVVTWVMAVWLGRQGTSV